MTSNGDGIINLQHRFIDLFESFYRLFMRISLPPVLDTIYQGSKFETPSSPYLVEMFKMTEPFEGIAINLQEKDMANAKANFNEFKAEYQKLSTMVPQWQEYWDINLVNQLGTDLNSGNVDAVFQKDLPNIGQSCDRCHGNEQPQVWAKYYWRDFDTVNVNTPEGKLPWPVAMPKYLATGFEGIGINIQEGKKQEAINSFKLFKSMLLNFKQACNDCHTTPRFYFVSDDVMKKVDEMGQDIQTGNFAAAQNIRVQLGDNCVRCHILHQPAQRMKDKMK